MEDCYIINSFILKRRKKMENRGKSIASMALGIASIVFCESGVVGLVCAIIGMTLSKQAIAEGGENGFNKAGKICSTIGLIISIIGFVVVIACAICTCAGAGAAALSESMYY